VAEAAVPLQLIVGLGNPGAEYAKTRHNAGAWFVEALCQDLHVHLKTERKLKSSLAKIKIANQDIFVLIPTTFMNHSGQAVSAVCQYYHIPIEAVLVVHDDLDLPTGTIRFKTDGGHGGHNGLRDIMHHLNARHFHRLRVGIGHPGHKSQVLDYVLQRPSKTEEHQIRESIEQAQRVLPDLIQGDFGRVMNQLHSL
jgi:peptidyl-tRNA hydrolase, PTH1 family